MVWYCWSACSVYCLVRGVYSGFGAVMFDLDNWLLFGYCFFVSSVLFVGDPVGLLLLWFI